MSENQRINSPSHEAVPTTAPSQQRKRTEEPNSFRSPGEGSPAEGGVETNDIQPGKTQGANLS